MRTTTPPRKKNKASETWRGEEEGVVSATSQEKSMNAIEACDEDK